VSLSVVIEKILLTARSGYNLGNTDKFLKYMINY